MPKVSETLFRYVISTNHHIMSLRPIIHLSLAVHRVAKRKYVCYKKIKKFSKNRLTVIKLLM